MRNALLLCLIGCGATEVLPSPPDAGPVDAAPTAVTPPPATPPVVFGPGEGEIVAASNLMDAAKELQSFIRLSTPLDMPIVATRTKAPKAIRLQLDETLTLSDEGFSRASPTAEEVLVSARSLAGLLNGVYDLLERDLGVRWLMPFPANVGTHVPKKQELIVPREARTESPAFINRFWVPVAVGDRELYGPWLRRMRASPNSIPSGHNMHMLLPPAKYRASNPEFYPLSNGERYPLVGDYTTPAALYHWQPVVDAPGIRAAAAATINEYFSKNPTVSWFSLGIGDTTRWDDRLLQMGAPNSLGLPSVSDPYYLFVNDVVAEVRKTHPNKFYGLLAYHNVVDPPSFKIDPSVVPFVTYDRFQWNDPARKAVDQRRTERWQAAATAFGLYDYLYGDGSFTTGGPPAYAAPRLYPHLMAEYLRHAAAHGARYYAAEAYPAPEWTEGPKLYLLAKLLWNPQANVDEVLADWYENAVGPAAAPHLARYFALWEQYWALRAVGTSWFKLSRGPYLSLRDASYLDALTPMDLQQMDEAMQQVVARASGEANQARASFFESGWQAVRARAFGTRFTFLNGQVPTGYVRTFYDGLEGTGMTPTGWTLGGSQSVRGFDSAIKKEGVSSYRMQLPASPVTSDYSYMYRTIQVSGKSSFCARMKVRSPSDGFGLHMNIAGRSPPVVEQKSVATGTDWRTIVSCGEAAGATSVLLYFSVPQGAEAWFDEIELYTK